MIINEKSNQEEICPVYAKGKAKKEFFLGNKIVLCTKSCPYHNNNPMITFFGEEVGNLCMTNGLAKKLKSDNLIQNTEINPHPDFIRSNLSSIIYM